VNFLKTAQSLTTTKSSTLQKLSKEELIHTTIVGMTKKLGPNGQLPTVKQLCQSLSVSRSTLDRVLRSLEKERLIVCRHGSGIFVSPHSNQRRIGLVFGGDIHDTVRYSQFWWLLHRAILDEADRHQNELRTYYSCPSSSGELTDPADFGLGDDLEGRRISGLIMAAVENLDQISWLKKWRVPLISLGEYPECDACVIPNRGSSLKMGLKALAEAGCKRVALVTNGVPVEDFEKERDRNTVPFKSICRELRLQYSPDLRWFENTLPAGLKWETHEEAGIHIIRHHLKKKSTGTPEGIFFTDDTSAHGGLIELLTRGIVPGKDIKIAVQTNKGASLLRPFHQQIFRVEIDPSKIASEMFRLVHVLINSGKTEERSIIVEPSLIKPSGK
jgi:DNA-binding LacI/PurR family transcriptional regulator